MKVRVTNLKPNTQYFFQINSTSKNSGSVFSYPDVPPYIEVTTEVGSVIVRNDVLAQQINMEDGTSTQGTLVIAEIDQASYPVTGWANDGVPEGWAAIDTNNFYDKDNHVNLELVGGEAITFIYFAGFMGSVETNDEVPTESGGIQQTAEALSLSGSGSGSESSSESSGGGGGVSCFIATASDGLFGF
jgi:hypothetical protein